MKNKIIYVITIIISVIYIIVGNKISTKDFTFFENNAQVNLEKAVVLEILGEQEILQQDFEGNNITIGKDIIFKAKILKNGDIVEAKQTFDDYAPLNQREIQKGDKLFLYENEEVDGSIAWYADELIRLDGIIVLVIIFIILILIFGRVQGINTIISLIFTCLAIFIVFIPSILSGQNIYISSIITCIYITSMTLLIVYGTNLKSLSAALGCLSGILIAGLLTAIMSNILNITGILNEESVYITYINDSTIDLRAIVFGSIIVGAIGAIMDVAMSLSSSLYELSINIENPKFSQILKSGFEIGRDIMGTMANTLILAYIGSSLSSVLLLCVYNNSLEYLLNKELIIVEVLQMLAGSIGIMMAIPFTTLISSLLYTRKNKEEIKQIEE